MTANFRRCVMLCDATGARRIIYNCVRWGFPRIKLISTSHIWERTTGHARKVNHCLMLNYTHVLDLNKTSASKMLMRHLNLPLPMDTNSGDERNFLSGAAKMPVPYHLDESDSDSIVSSKFTSYFYFLCLRVVCERALSSNRANFFLKSNFMMLFVPPRVTFVILPL